MDDGGRARTIVRGGECLHADRVVHLPDGVIPRAYPYGELVLTTYWVPPESIAPARNERSLGFRLACETGAFTMNSEGLAFVARKHPLAPTPPGPEWNHANAQFGVTWRIPQSMRERIDPTVLRHLDARNPQRFAAAPLQVYPWADPAGNPELVLEARVRIPTEELRGAGAHAQFNFMFYVLDTVNGKFFSYIVNLHANPEEPMTAVRNDGEFAFISAQLPRDGSLQREARYFRRSAVSRGNSPVAWNDSRFFRIHVGREHILNAIHDLNASDVDGARGFSTDPARYLLTSAGLIQEHVWHRGESVVMASSFSGFAISLEGGKTAPR